MKFLIKQLRYKSLLRKILNNYKSVILINHCFAAAEEAFACFL